MPPNRFLKEQCGRSVATQVKLDKSLVNNLEYRPFCDISFTHKNYLFFFKVICTLSIGIELTTLRSNCTLYLLSHPVAPLHTLENYLLKSSVKKKISSKMNSYCDDVCTTPSIY